MDLSLELSTLVIVAVAAVLTGILHGATGMAGGIVMAALLAHFVGIKNAVPIMTVALLLSHLSRAILYAGDTNWTMVRQILLFGCPTIVVGAMIFNQISPTAVAIVFSACLAVSIPFKYWARQRNIKTGPRLLATASSVWGMIAGNVTGPSFFLAPFLLGTGINRMAFVGTLATVTLAMNLLKTTVFGFTGILNWQVILVGVFIGVLSIPGNWLGRLLLQRVKDRDHSMAIDALTVLMILNFGYLAMNAK